jgi:predicted dehydrogenase
MAHEHANGYLAMPGVQLVACADLSRENADAFAADFGLSGVYTHYPTMLRKEKLDIISVCTWPHLHAPMVIAAAKSGVKAIHCEKPMADSWGASLKMAEAAKKHRVRLTFNHQRRFGAPFQTALRLIKSGKIGKLTHLESYVPNIYDMGTHWIDLMGMLNHESPALWVIGQLDCRTLRRVFGAPVEGQGIWQWLYENGVHGLISAGSQMGGKASLRARGTEGQIDINWDEPVLHAKLRGMSKMKVIPLKENIHGPGFVARAMADVVKAIRQGKTSQLSAENALKTTEIIFGCYESARVRGRVDLPLKIRDNPLEAMIQSGQLRPKAQPKPKK